MTGWVDEEGRLGNEQQEKQEVQEQQESRFGGR